MSLLMSQLPRLLEKSIHPLNQFGLLGRPSSAASSISLLSSAYNLQPTINCLPLFKQAIPCALVFALDNAGISIAARIAMIAITTSNSMSVKASFAGLVQPEEPSAFGRKKLI